MQTHADLNLIGQGTSTHGTYNLIYDTDLDITWFDYSKLYDTWQNQVDWAAGLSVTFGSNTYTDWRLPTTIQPDSTCDAQFDPGGGFPLQGYGGNCTGSEMGHLYYTELGNTFGPGGFTNTGDFQNLQPFIYWSGTTDATRTSHAWYFSLYFADFFGPGYQDIGIKVSRRFNAIAVRSGLAVVPEPISSTLFIVGGATLGFRRFRRRK